MHRSHLAALLWNKTSPRYRRAMERGRIEIVGVFQSRQTGNRYLAVRIKAHRSLWLRVYEVRRPHGRYEILVLPAQAPEWQGWEPELYQGDNMPAYRRCRRFVERQRPSFAMTARSELPAKENQYE